MKKVLPLLIFLSSLIIHGQKTPINGSIQDKLGKVINAHIINKNTKEGTFSNENGIFIINATLGDELEITSIQHHTQKVTVANIIIKTKKININLHLKDYVLDEVEIKKTNLYGFLERDFKQTPEDVAVVKSKGALDFSKINFEEKVILPEDEIDKSKVDISKKTDPTQKFEGISLLKFSLFTRKKEKRLAQKIAREKLEDQLTKNIVNLIGKHAFTKHYKIPSDKIYHFINFNRSSELINLVKNKEVFKLIEFLKEKSIIYLKEINKNP